MGKYVSWIEDKWLSSVVKLMDKYFVQHLLTKLLLTPAQCISKDATRLGPEWGHTACRFLIIYHTDTWKSTPNNNSLESSTHNAGLPAHDIVYNQNSTLKRGHSNLASASVSHGRTAYSYQLDVRDDKYSAVSCRSLCYQLQLGSINFKWHSINFNNQPGLFTDSQDRDSVTMLPWI